MSLHISSPQSKYLQCDNGIRDSVFSTVGLFPFIKYTFSHVMADCCENKSPRGGSQGGKFSTFLVQASSPKCKCLKYFQLTFEIHNQITNIFFFSIFRSNFFAKLCLLKLNLEFDTQEVILPNNCQSDS